MASSSRSSPSSEPSASQRSAGPRRESSRSSRRPIHTYTHGGSRCAITGGYVVHDRGLGSLLGRYVYGDLCTGQIRSLKPRLGGARDDSYTGIDAGSQLVSFGEDARHNVYVVAGSSVYRIAR